MSAYTSSPPTIRKIARVTESTSIERPKIECAGVAAGLKMLVGDCADLARARNAAPYAAKPPALLLKPVEYPSKQDKLSDLECALF